MSRKVGREIEVRYATLADGSEEFDEIVASRCSVHLEKMSDQTFCLIVTTARERAYFWIASTNGRSHITASEYGREVRSARQERRSYLAAQKRLRASVRRSEA